MDNRQKRFEKFIRKLEQLSKETGVLIHSTGGVMISDDNIEAVSYSKDYTSGDLEYSLLFKEEQPSSVISSEYKFTERQMALLDATFKHICLRQDIEYVREVECYSDFCMNVDEYRSFAENSDIRSAIKIITDLVKKGVLWPCGDHNGYMLDPDFIEKLPKDFSFKNSSFKTRYKEKTI